MGILAAHLVLIPICCVVPAGAIEADRPMAARTSHRVRRHVVSIGVLF